MLLRVAEALGDRRAEAIDVLGVHLAGGKAYLAYRSKDGRLVDDPVLRRMEPSEFMAAADGLHDFWARFRQLLRGHRPHEVVVLHTRSYQSWAYKDAFKRASLETAVMLAARAEDVPYKLISQETVANCLGLPPKWKAKNLSLAATRLSDERPPYWGERALAYAAAVTAAAGSGGGTDDR